MVSGQDSRPPHKQPPPLYFLHAKQPYTSNPQTNCCPAAHELTQLLSQPEAGPRESRLQASDLLEKAALPGPEAFAANHVQAFNELCRCVCVDLHGIPRAHACMPLPPLPPCQDALRPPGTYHLLACLLRTIHSWMRAAHTIAKAWAMQHLGSAVALLEVGGPLVTLVVT